MAQASLKLNREIEQQTRAPDHIVAGLKVLAGLPPLWPAGNEAWRLTLAHVKDFAERWDCRARATGWDDVTLYGVHRRAPGANYSALGAAWLAARSAYAVLAIESDATIVVGTRTASRLRIYPHPPSRDAVLPWYFHTNQYLAQPT